MPSQPNATITCRKHPPAPHRPGLVVLSSDGGRGVGGSSRGDRSYIEHPGVHSGADPCNQCGCLHGQIDKRKAVCFCAPLYLDGCMQKFACTVRMHGYTFICTRYARKKVYTGKRSGLHGPVDQVTWTYVYIVNFGVN